MPNCILRYCHNYSQRAKKCSDGVTYHKLPRPGHENREYWIKFIQNNRSEDSWLPSEHTCICSEHFRKNDYYITKTGRRYLTKSAVPVENPLSEDNSNARTNTNTITKSESILDTPRKIRLKKHVRKISAAKKTLVEKNCKLKRQNRYLKSKNPKLTDIIQKLKTNFPVESLIENENKLLQEATVVETYIKVLTKFRQSKKKFLYFPFVRNFALTLNYYSAAAYRYVRKSCNNALPHPRTLSSWYGSINAEPGFTEEAFKALELKSTSASSEKPVVYSLIFDEMAIRQQKLFKNKKLGFVNFGTGPQEVKATQVLVFMLVSLTENWKIPVGYFLAASISAESKVTLIKICLEKCHKVGVRVVSLTFNGCKTNFSAVEALGCQFNDVANMKTHFRHPSTFENVYVFVDPCHVIKLIRNAFENNKIFFDENNKKVKWQLLVNLNKLQQNEGLKFPNKLSPRHIHFRNQVMKVKLATQLLSKSIAKTFELCDEVLKSSQFLDTAGTVYFITLINNLFDVLNSQRCYFYGYKSPLCSKNKDNIFKLLNEVKTYIISLKIQIKQTRVIKRLNRDPRIIMNILKKNVVQSQRQTGFVGALICIESLKNMYFEMVEEKRIMSYISTYRISQDHLELSFGCIRKHGGNNNNPNVIQFRAAYKKILSHLELRSSYTDNCIPLDNFSISTTSSINVINSTSRTNRQEDEEFQVHPNDNQLLNSDIEASVNCKILAEKLNTLSLTSASRLIVGYISGHVARRLMKKIKCEECITNLTTSIKLWHHKLITLKDMGGLCYSTDDVFEVCLKTEAFIRSLIRENGGQSLPAKLCNINYILTNTLKVFLGSDIFRSMSFHSLQQPSTHNHRTHLIRAIIEKYTVIRLHHEACTDSDISSHTKRQKLTKLILF